MHYIENQQMEKVDIVLVEDDYITALVFKQFFGHRNYSVAHFGNAESCLEWLKSGECKILITDINLQSGGLDGIGLLNEISLNHFNSSMKIACVSGYPNDGKIVGMDKFDKHFVKPLDHFELLEWIANC